MNKKNKKIMLSLKDVSLDIPLYNNQNRTIKNLLTNSVGSVIRKEKRKRSSVLALRTINCDFREGDRVGLMGHNGSGKTSLLKIASGIYQPTSGEIKKKCKIQPMIYKGFLVNHELTGFDAIKAFYLFIKKNRKGFNEFFNEILDFSDIGEFINMPIKTYSEGMASRLQFAMFTGLKHECLVMDEGFGTGDFKFFDKAQKRLEDFINASGLFILASHSDEMLKNFCRRGVVLKKGSLVFDGPIQDALNYYHNDE